MGAACRSRVRAFEGGKNHNAEHLCRCYGYWDRLLRPDLHHHPQLPMSAVCTKLGKKEPAAPAAAPAVPAAPAANAIPNRQAMIAAISAAVAEDMGTDPAGIRILSVKKL